jgi:hypothetical protein
MTETKDTLVVRANVAITPMTLQAIVANAKKLAGTGEKGYYTVDTADQVSNMISRFLEEMDFESYVMDIDNYNLNPA